MIFTPYKCILQNLLFFILLFLASAIQAQETYSKSLVVDPIKLGNLLEWETEDVMNIKIFHVERSENGSDFESISVMDAEDNKAYRYLDILSTSGTRYYRLREISFDNSETFTQIVRVGKDFIISDYSSTEVKYNFFVTIESISTGEMIYTLTNSEEIVLLRSTKSIKEGLNQFEIPMMDKSTGDYILSFKMGDQIEKLNISRK